MLLVHKGVEHKTADCTLACTWLQLMGLMILNKEVLKTISVEGDRTVPVRLIKYMTPFSTDFNIIEP